MKKQYLLIPLVFAVFGIFVFGMAKLKKYGEYVLLAVQPKVNA